MALISTFGCLNGWILIQGRIPLAAAKDGLFPARFSRLHGRRGTPVFALVVSSLLVSALIAMNYNKALIDQFTFIILLATLTTVVPYAFAAAAEVYLFIFERERFPAGDSCETRSSRPWGSRTRSSPSGERVGTSSARDSCC